MDEKKKIPERVGPYRIERELGSGGMGTVYFGTHETSGREAAVKVLPASMAREEGFVARFTREIDALRKLQSPHIVELYESGVDDETYFYSMEYVDGETLTARLTQDRRIPWREAIELAVQVCRALKSAHNAGVIHRDLKPSNLMITSDGNVKLTDFGVAQVFAGGKLTMTGGVIGTAEYMSPEQAQGRRATKQSDIYSLGAVLYVMLTGRPPFTGKTAMDIAQKHIHNRFDSPKQYVDELPHWLDEVVCKCMEKKPEDRYPDAHVLSLRLAEIPKKVDYAKGKHTFEFDDAHATAETIAEAAGRGDEHDVGGTLMRDLMQAHIDRERADSPVGALLDNTWVLVGLLSLLILGGVWWYRSGIESPEDLFARGEELMQRPRGSAWERADEECFAPLLDLDAERWGPKIDPYLDQIAAYEVERKLLGPRLVRSAALRTSEAERFLQQALEALDRGEMESAKSTLESLDLLLQDDEESEQWRRATRQLLKEIDEKKEEPQSTSDQYPMLRSALDRAAELEESGEEEQARKIRKSVVDLYGTDPRAGKMVEEARRLLEGGE